MFIHYMIAAYVLYKVKMYYMCCRHVGGVPLSPELRMASSITVSNKQN